MMRLLNTVLQEEGANALCKGMNATYYGSVLYGFSYFYTYCALKVKGHDFFEKRNKLPLLYFCSGVVAEYLALLVYFPYETVKVRLQSSSHRYQGLCDGLFHVLKRDGVRFLYRGYFWYASHYSLNYSVQIAMYETCIAHYKKEYP
jgi:hypothetical protein